MELNMETIKKTDTKKIYEILKPVINDIYISYKFINISEEEFSLIVNKEIEKSKKEYDNKTEYLKYMKKRISIELLNLTKEKLKDKRNAIEIADNYINKKFISINSNKDCIENIKILSHLFERYSFTFSIDIIIEILNKNEKLNKTVKFLVNKYYNQIKEGKINKIIKDPFVSTVIEAYCISNNIEITEPEEDFDVDLELKQDTDIIKLYLNEIGKIPVLSPDEERELGIRILQNDQKAKDIMIERNLRLVIGVAKRYLNRGISFSDLIQEGNLGLIEAVEKFDVRLGYKFSTYAIWWIRQKVCRYISNNGRNIRIPVHMNEKIYALKKTKNKLEISLKRQPTLQELSDEMKISIEELKKLMFFQNDTISLNAAVGDKQDTYLEECVSSDEESIEDRILNSTLKAELEKILENCGLTQRESMIILLRYGLNKEECLTLEEIGKKLGITRERVRQIESKAFMKIRRSRYIKDLAEYTKNPDRALRNIDYYRYNYSEYSMSNRYKAFLNADNTKTKRKENK